MSEQQFPSRSPSPAPPATGVSAPPPGRFRGGTLLAWLGVCALLGAASAAAALAIRDDFDPPILAPLFYGAILGTLLVLALRMGNVGHRPTALAGGVLAVAIAVVGQHFFDYWQMHCQASSPQGIAATEPLGAGFPQFLRAEAERGREIPWLGTLRGGGVWLSWGVDAALLAAAALALLWSAARMPFCDRCRSWYHTLRAGRLDPATAESLAAGLAVALPPEFDSARYRLSNCQGGCGPAAVELFWVEAAGDCGSGRKWLDAAERYRIEKLLDERLEAMRVWKPKRRRRRRDTPEPPRET